MHPSYSDELIAKPSSFVRKAKESKTTTTSKTFVDTVAQKPDLF